MTAMPWAMLRDELDCWRAEGRTATMWWRDDDAVTVTPALERLLAIARDQAVPVALAVVPAGADATLKDRLTDADGVRVLQHGYGHVNHAAAGDKKCELAQGRPWEQVAAELSWGRARLSALFRQRALPVLVPPWNRIDIDILQCVGRLGYRGVSMFGGRARRTSKTGLMMVNTHVDPIDWRAGRGFVGERRALAALAGHLRARRRGDVDAAEPTGLLTHHLDHDATGWAFLERLAAATRAHPAVRWLGADTVFGPESG